MDGNGSPIADASVNKPDPQATPHTRGDRRRVAKLEQLERRKLLMGFMVNRIDPEQVYREMHERFGMTRRAVTRLRLELERAMAADGQELLPVLKGKTVNRLHAHIIKATRDGSWNAVASLERLLSDVQGTREAVQVNVNVDATVREAVVHLLAAAPPAELDALAAQGAALLTAHGEPVAAE